jgi:hypothetical protein
MVDGMAIRLSPFDDPPPSDASTCLQSSRGVAESRKGNVGGNVIGRKAGKRGSHQRQVARGPRETEGNQ